MRARLLLGGSVSLLLLAWVFSTQPFASPDEAFHYLRALSIANGKLVGPRVPYRFQGLTPAQAAWVAPDTQRVVVPAGMSPSNIGCVPRQDLSGSCVEPTATGDYPPLPYLLPAVALKVSSDATTGLWLSRLVAALSCAAFLLLAVVLACRGGPWPLLGLLIALTPMVFFVGSILNPSGLETASSIAFVAALLRLARSPRSPGTRLWLAIGVSGTVVVLSGQLGPVFAGLEVIIAAALLGRARLGQLIASERRWVVGVGVVLIAAVGLYVVTGATSGAFHSTLRLRPFRWRIDQGFDQMQFVLKDAIGNFGLLTVHLPAVMHWLWWLLVVTLVGLAIWASRMRDRLLMLSSIAIALVFPVLFYAFIYRDSGFGLQGRQVLALLVVIPMLAGELLASSEVRVDRALANRLFQAVVIVIAVFELAAWWINSRSSAGEPHAFWFLGHAAWTPPLGWWPWLLAALGGAAALSAVAVVRRPFIDTT